MSSKRFGDFLQAFSVITLTGYMLYFDTTVYTPSDDPLGISFAVMAFIIGFVGLQISDNEARLGRFEFSYKMGRMFETFIVASFWITAAILRIEKPFATDWRSGGPEMGILIMALFMMSRFEKFRLDDNVQTKDAKATTAASASPPV